MENPIQIYFFNVFFQLKFFLMFFVLHSMSFLDIVPKKSTNQPTLHSYLNFIMYVWQLNGVCAFIFITYNFHLNSYFVPESELITEHLKYKCETQMKYSGCNQHKSIKIKKYMWLRGLPLSLTRRFNILLAWIKYLKSLLNLRTCLKNKIEK